MGKTKIPGVESAKAVFDGTTGYGEEVLPEGISNKIIMRVWENSWVRKSIQSVPMKEQVVKIPKIVSGIQMYGTTGNKNVAATESRHGTSEITLTMKTIIGNCPIDKKTIAYALPSTMPALEQDIYDSVIETEEDVFINGDTTAGAGNINGDYHVTNFPNGVISQDPRLELDGLRHMAASGVTVNASGASLTQTHLRKAFAQLGKYARNKADILVLVSNSVETTVLGWDDIRTIDKYDKGATILNGEIGKIFGTKVIASGLMSDTLDTTGVERNQSGGSSADDRTVVLVFNKRSPIIGNPVKAERKFKIEIEDEKKEDQIVLVPKEDFAFTNRYDEAICQIINVLPGTT